MIKHAAIASALVALGGCPKLLDVELEVREVCMTQRDIAVPGVPGDEDQSLSKKFPFDDLDGVHKLVDLDANLEFVRAELSSPSGTPLDFVNSAHLKISSGGLPTLQLLNCDGDCLADGTITIPASIQHDAVEYLRGKSLLIDVGVEGKMPTEDWTMDVTLCMKGALNYGVSP